MNESKPQAIHGQAGHRVPADILDELGLLPAADPAEEAGDENTPENERRADRRVPTKGTVRVMLLAGDRPIGGPFSVSGLDISRGGVKLGGNAPLLLGSRMAVELKRSDGVGGLLCGTVCHSTFGDPTQMRNDNACTAGVRFSSLDDALVREHFTDGSGTVSLDAAWPDDDPANEG
jgi:hypothetical protein